MVLIIQSKFKTESLRLIPVVTKCVVQYYSLITNQRLHCIFH